jgi:hypothetical protein
MTMMEGMSLIYLSFCFKFTVVSSIENSIRKFYNTDALKLI